MSPAALWLAVPLGVLALGAWLWRHSQRARREERRSGRKPNPNDGWFV